MNTKKIVVLDAATLGDDLSLAPLEAVGQVTVYRTSPPDTVRDRIRDADAVILNKVKIGPDQLPDAPHAPGIICVAATGFDNIDLAAARARGVAVANVRGYSSDSVAQVTVSMAPTAQYIGAVAIKPISRLLQSGSTPKITHTATGNISSSAITERFQMAPSLWTESI